jgi:hypothetical protein
MGPGPHEDLAPGDGKLRRRTGGPDGRNTREGDEIGGWGRNEVHDGGAARDIKLTVYRISANKGHLY